MHLKGVSCGKGTQLPICEERTEENKGKKGGQRRKKEKVFFKEVPVIQEAFRRSTD